MIKKTVSAAVLILLLGFNQGYSAWESTGGLAGTITRVLAVNNNTLIAGTDDGIFKSPDNGATWIAINAGLAKDTVVSLFAGAGILYAGLLHSGVYVSADNGLAWTAIINGLPKDPDAVGSYLQVNGLAALNGKVYAGTLGRGIFVASAIDGVWSELNRGLTDKDVYALLGTRGELLAATGAGGGIFRLSRPFTQWKEINNGLNYMPGMVYGVHTLAALDYRLFAGTFSDGVFASLNNGASWKPANSGLIASTVLALYAQGGNLYAGTGDNGVFHSRDYGTSWQALSDGLPAWDAVLSLCANNGVLFASLYNSGIWRMSALEPLSSPTTAVTATESSALKSFSINNSSAHLRYTLPQQDFVKVTYYDLSGRLVASLVNQTQSAGSYQVSVPISFWPEGFYIQVFQAGTIIDKTRIRVVH